MPLSRALIIVLLIGSILTMCAKKTGDLPDQEPEYGIMPGQHVVMTEDELSQKIPVVLKGDPEAAYEIAVHFLLGHRVLDMHKSIEWHIISIENHPVNNGKQSALAGFMLRSRFDDSAEFHTRGIFWLYGLAKIGYKTNYYDAEDYLNENGYTLETAKPPDDILFPFDYKNLSEAEIAICKKGALQGNIKASMLLAKYYEEITEDNELAEYWYRICVQNGSKECQYKLGQILSKKDDPLSQIRGQFWLERQSHKIGLKR